VFSLHRQSPAYGKKLRRAALSADMRVSAKRWMCGYANISNFFNDSKELLFLGINKDK
jgi:hypothetical protein